jgi:hypothetical protein
MPQETPWSAMRGMGNPNISMGITPMKTNAPKLSVESISTLEAIHKESPQLDNKYFRN